MLGLTATATMVTAASVAKHLGILDYQTGTIRGSPVPGNLCLSVSRDDDRDEALMTLLQGERFSRCQSIIVYCTRREETGRVATLIRTCLQDVVTEVSEDAAPTVGRGKAKKGERLGCHHPGMSAQNHRSIV